MKRKHIASTSPAGPSRLSGLWEWTALAPLDYKLPAFRDSIGSKYSTLIPQTKLRQLLAATDQDLAQALSSTESSDRELEALREIGTVPRGQPAPTSAGWSWLSSGAVAALPLPGCLSSLAPVPPLCPPPALNVPPRQFLVHERPP